MDENQRGLKRASTDTPQYKRGKNYFLGIGIDAYSQPYNRLRNCVNDITKVRETLLAAYDFEEEHTHVLFDSEATRKGIIKKLRDLLDKVGEDDSLIFMYSGHGDNLDSTNVGFMIPADAADEEDFINLSDIKSRLDAAKAKHIFVIFDACFSGLLLTQRDARAQNLPENFPSRYAMTSGRNHPVDDGTGEHSPFAKALIDELRENDDSLGSVMLAQRILDRFRRTGKDDDQLPAFGRISADIEYEGQYYFYPKNYELSAARERTKRLEAEQARRMAEEALINAERERKRAEKLARAASNAACFMQLRDQSPTFSLRMVHYNLLRHPDSAISHAMFYKSLIDKSVFITQLLRGSAIVESLCFAHDASFLVTGNAGGMVKIWQFKTGKCLQVFDNQGVGIYALALSKDNKFLYMGDGQSMVQVFSLEKNKVIKTFKNDKQCCTALALSGDEKRLAIGYLNGDIEIYTIADGKQQYILRGGEESVYRLYFIENDQQLASLDKSCVVKFWDLTTGNGIKTVEEKGKSFYYASLSNDGQLIVLCHQDGRARVQKLSTSEKIGTFGSSETPIFSANFSDDNRFLLTFDSDIVGKLWSLETGELLKTCRSENGIVNSLAFSNDKNWLALSHQDQTVSIWCLKDDLSQKTHDSAQFYPCALTLTNDEKHMLIGSQDPPSVSLKSMDGTEIRTYVKPDSMILFSGLTPDNQYVVVSDNEKGLLFYNFQTGKLFKKIKLFDEQIEGVSILNFTTDGRKMVACIKRGNVKLVEFPSGKILHTFGDQEQNISSLALTSDDKYLLTGSYDGKAQLWSLESGALIHTFLEGGTESEIGVEAVAISSDNRYAAFGFTNYKIGLHDLGTGAWMRDFLGHQNIVSSLVFTKDNQFLLSGAGDMTTKLWSVETGAPLKTFVGHKAPIKSIILLSDNQGFISVDESGVIKFWSFTDAVEDNLAAFPLYEFVDWQFGIEPEDTPQYIEELVASVEKLGMEKELALEIVQRQFKDPSVLNEVKRRLG